MERDWALAAFPLETSVLKLRLRPYSCGHEILLCQINSPLVLGGELSWNDLFVAALICSQTFAEGRNLIVQPSKVKWFARAWGLVLRLSNCPLQVELKKLQAHIKTGSWAPETNELKTGYNTRTLKAPRVYRLIPLLFAKLGLSESEALDFPMARANAYAAAEADKEGTIDLRGGSNEDTLLSHLDDLEARAAKGENVWDF